MNVPFRARIEPFLYKTDRTVHDLTLTYKRTVPFKKRTVPYRAESVQWKLKSLPKTTKEACRTVPKAYNFHIWL